MPTPLTWDSPAGLTYDMPGLTWDAASPDPPAPKPKKPFRLSPKPTHTPTPHIMSTFKFNSAPKSTGCWFPCGIPGTQCVLDAESKMRGLSP